VSNLEILELILLGILLMCSAFFSSSEAALFSLNPIQVHRMRREKPRAADRVERLLATPTHLLSTILIGNTLVNIVAASLGFSIAANHFPGHGEAIAIPVMTILLLLFGEITPKRFTMPRAPQLAVLYAPVLQVLVSLMAPARLGLEMFAKLFSVRERKSLTEDEFLTVVEVSQEEGVLGVEERNMIDGIIALSELQASQVMTPRVDLIGVDLEDSAEGRLASIAGNVQFRYLPVYRRNMDHPEGFLDVSRYLLSPDRNFEAAVIPLYFVPETARLDKVLAAFQKEHRSIAFVADEYGGTAGLLTLSDILEEIVADIGNEYGIEKLTIQKMSDNRWIVDGSMNIDDINYELGVELDAEGADRIAGWVAAHLGRIPRTGDVVESQGCRILVHRTRKRRVVTVLIDKVPVVPAGEEDP
jgi:CBS domain containing-hemolysin-like protein